MNGPTTSAEVAHSLSHTEVKTVFVKNLESLQTLSGPQVSLSHTLASKASSQNTRTVHTLSTHSSLLVSCLEPNDSSRGTS